VIFNVGNQPLFRIKEGSCHLGNRAEVYDAELHAVQEAVSALLTIPILHSKAFICIDNQATVSTLQCGEPGRTSPLRSGGALPTRVCPGTRKRTNGRSLRRKAKSYVEWNHSQGLSRTSSGRSQRRNGRRPASGPAAGSARRSTRCRPDRNQTGWLQVAPRGTPQGSIS
jgi:hypothetical protein